MSDKPKLTASVVGGGSGGKLSITALVNSPYFELVAVTDINPDVCKSLSKQFPGIKTFTNYKEMFVKCPTDIVCVSTYPPTHELITIDALKNPLKGILVEKPLGDTSASGRRIINAIKNKNIPMVVPHGLMAKKVPIEIILSVHKGEIGELKLLEIQCDKWDIINAGIHWMNFFVNLIKKEPIDYVMAICESSTRTYRDGMQVETTAVTYIQTKSGIRAVMNTGDAVKINDEGKGTIFRLVGTSGHIEFFGWDNSYRILNAEHPKGETIIPDEFQVTGHQRHLENMAEMIYSEKVDYSIPESSLIALEICEGAYISNRHRCKVTFPLEEFKIPKEQTWDPGTPYNGTGGGRDGRKLL